MDQQEFRKLLESSSDKLNIFRDRSILVQYKFSVIDLTTIIDDFLNDEQKVELMEIDHFKRLNGSIKASIVKSISNDKIKLNFLYNDEFISSLSDYDIEKVAGSLGAYGSKQILFDSQFLKAHNIKNCYKALLKSLNDQDITELLYNKKLIEEELQLRKSDIIDFIEGLKDEQAKRDMITLYDFKEYDYIDIVKTFSDDSKKDILLQNSYPFSKHNVEELIRSFSTDSLIDFLNNNKDFLAQKNLKPYQITRYLEKDMQLEFVSKLEECELSLNEKRLVLATLGSESKKEIDTSSFPQEYVSAIMMHTIENFDDIFSYGNIEVDLSGDLERYRGLDELISIKPMSMGEEEKNKLLQLLEICPSMAIKDDLVIGESTVEEYKNAEAWIESVLENLNNDWTDIQKLAYIDNAIGRKISYSPDFDTEVFDAEAARSLWKIVDSGYGVCNGIAQVEKYMLSKVGIEAEAVSSGSHTFLKVKGIEIPKDNGETVKGDTIVDGTWNLADHRYGAKPENFCRSYKEIRKHDINSEGKDLECHKNDEVLASATLDLDEQSLRKVFRSIGLTDKEGNFPIKELLDKSKIIDDKNLPTEESILQQLSLLMQYYPEFATCQNSTLLILKGTLLEQENLDFDRCVASRVYEREDEDKRPLMYVYVALSNGKEVFYYADKTTKQFVELSQKEFESRFECYEKDIQKQGGVRPWEENNRTEYGQDLATSSGKVIAQEENDEGER